MAENLQDEQFTKTYAFETAAESEKSNNRPKKDSLLSRQLAANDVSSTERNKERTLEPGHQTEETLTSNLSAASNEAPSTLTDNRNTVLRFKTVYDFLDYLQERHSEEPVLEVPDRIKEQLRRYQLNRNWRYVDPGPHEDEETGMFYRRFQVRIERTCWESVSETVVEFFKRSFWIFLYAALFSLAVTIYLLYNGKGMMALWWGLLSTALTFFIIIVKESCRPIEVDFVEERGVEEKLKITQTPSHNPCETTPLLSH